MTNATAGAKDTLKAPATAWTRPSSEYMALLRAGAAQQAGAAARRESALAVYLPNNDAHGTLGSLFVLAEGVGKLPGSAMACKTAVEGIIRLYYSSPARQPGNRLQSAVARAGELIFEQAEKQPQLLGMGSTLVCAVIAGDKLWIAGVGNSRAYLLRPNTGKLELLTRTHALGDAGSGQALGLLRQSGAHHIGPLTIAAGDILMLCSSSLAAGIEAGAPQRFLNPRGDMSGPDDAQELADALARSGVPACDNGATITVACQAVVPLAAAQRAGWPKRYARQLVLPVPRNANQRPPAAPADQPTAAGVPSSWRPTIAPAPLADSQNGAAETPQWLNERRADRSAVPGTAQRAPRAAPQKDATAPAPADRRAPTAPRPIVTAAADSGSATATMLHGAPQWVSHLVIVTAIGILSTMAGVVVGLGPQYWLSASGVAIAVIAATALLLSLLHRSRRARPLQAAQAAHQPQQPQQAQQSQQAQPSLRISRRPFMPAANGSVPQAHKLSTNLHVDNTKLDYVPVVGAQRTPPTKVNIRDENGTVVGRLAVGAPEHLIDQEIGKPIGFYVLLWDAVSNEERAKAWLTPGSQQGEGRQSAAMVLRDVAVAGEDARLRVSLLRGGANFTLESATLSAELELVFYRYTDALRKITIDSVQVGVKNVKRMTGGG